jgi:hypothetical protein
MQGCKWQHIAFDHFGGGGGGGYIDHGGPNQERTATVPTYIKPNVCYSLLLPERYNRNTLKSSHETDRRRWVSNGYDVKVYRIRPEYNADNCRRD